MAPFTSYNNSLRWFAVCVAWLLTLGIATQLSAQTTPACCGDACGDGVRCCTGTVCGSSGRCVPTECGECGDRGCQVDYDACTVTCGIPRCCFEPCTSDLDCCTGATCQGTAANERQCLPSDCQNCTGMTPTCMISSECEATCHPPSTCGQECTDNSDCGIASVCYDFPAMSRCVPSVFESQCVACGTGGCRFSPDNCSVECPE